MDYNNKVGIIIFILISFTMDDAIAFKNYNIQMLKKTQSLWFNSKFNFTFDRYFYYCCRLILEIVLRLYKSKEKWI